MSDQAAPQTPVAAPNPFVADLQAMLLSDALIVNSAAQALLSNANAKVIASNGDINVAISAYSSVAVLAPLTAPTLIPQLILQGALTFQKMQAQLATIITGKLTS